MVDINDDSIWCIRVMLHFPNDLYFILTSKKYYYPNIDNVRKNYIKFAFPNCIIPTNWKIQNILN